MPHLNDSASLMREFCESGSPDAFRELVNRYLPLVFSAAMRRGNGDKSLAQDVSQLVFADFARRMPRLRADDRIGGWLYRAALQRTGDVMKSERRRRRREQQAVAMQEIERIPEEEGWELLSPVVDRAMGKLRPADRQILINRFFEGMRTKAIAQSLNVSEEAAQKRVERALGRLRGKLAGVGIPVASVSVLTGILSFGGSSPAATVDAGIAEQVSTASLEAADVGAGASGFPRLADLVSLPLPRLQPQRLR